MKKIFAVLIINACCFGLYAQSTLPNVPVPAPRELEEGYDLAKLKAMYEEMGRPQRERYEREVPIVAQEMEKVEQYKQDKEEAEVEFNTSVDELMAIAMAGQQPDWGLVEKAAGAAAQKRGLEMSGAEVFAMEHMSESQIKDVVTAAGNLPTEIREAIENEHNAQVYGENMASALLGSMGLTMADALKIADVGTADVLSTQGGGANAASATATGSGGNTGGSNTGGGGAIAGGSGGIVPAYTMGFDEKKNAFDDERTREREAVARQMEQLYRSKYLPLLESANAGMKRCSDGTPESVKCFNDAYLRWQNARKDFRSECFVLWREQIAKEQREYTRLFKAEMETGEHINAVIGDYNSFTIDAFTLPHLEL